VEQLRVGEEGGAAWGVAEHVQRGVGVEADPAEGRVEEGGVEGAGGEQAGSGGEAVKKEKAGEAAQEGGVGAGFGFGGRRGGGVNAAAEVGEWSKQAASPVHVVAEETLDDGSVAACRRIARVKRHAVEGLRMGTAKRHVGER
jgi:hypothetical protein